MSDAVVSAAPVAASTPATPTNTPNTSADLTADDSALESELDAADDSATEPDPKAAKGGKKEVAKAKEVEKRLKKLKLKVDGKEIEETLDLDNDEELIRHLQMSKMGQSRAQKHAELEKQVSSFFSAFGKDPFAAMQELGMDPNKAIDAYINQQLEQAKKSPEQLAKEKLETELSKLKSEREREKEEFKQQELARLQEQAFTQYDMQMEQVLAKSNLPKTPYVVKKMADYMLVALEAGKDVSPEDVVGLVEEEMNSDLKQMFASLPEDQIEALLGEQVLNKMRKRRISKAQSAQAAVGKPKVTETGKTSATDKPKEKMSFKDFFKM